MSLTFGLSIQPAQQRCRQREALVDDLDIGNGVCPFARRCQISAAVPVDRVVTLLAKDRIVRPAAQQNVGSVSPQEGVNGRSTVRLPPLPLIYQNTT